LNKSHHIHRVGESQPDEHGRSIPEYNQLFSISGHGRYQRHGKLSTLEDPKDPKKGEMTALIRRETSRFNSAGP